MQNIQTNETLQANGIKIQKETMNMIVQSENQDKKRKTSKIVFIGVSIVIAIAVLIGLGIYNAPVSRLNRQLSLGQKYLEDQQYEEAILAFNQAIEIDDRCIEAYAGGIEAYQELGNLEELYAFYDRALNVVQNLEGEVLVDNASYIGTIFLAVSEIYDDNPEKIQAVLLGSFNVFDKILEGNNMDEQMIRDLGSCLKQYIEMIIDTNIEEAKSLLEKYRDVLLEDDIKEILGLIEEYENLKRERIAFMQKAYDLMKAGNYDAMQEIYEIQMETPYFTDSEVYYGDGMGIGIGFYGTEYNEYFYYGEYQNGMRSGKGVSYQYIEPYSGYRVFVGEWQNDAPNGWGEEKRSYATFDSLESTEKYLETIKGNLCDGFWDGEVQFEPIWDNYKFNLSFNVENGVIKEDKTEEFYAMAPWLNYQREYDSDDIYAYHVIGNQERYKGATLENREGKILGTVGYGHMPYGDCSVFSGNWD